MGDLNDDLNDARGRGRVIDDAFDDGISSVFWARGDGFHDDVNDDVVNDDDAMSRSALAATSWSGDVRVYAARPHLLGRCANIARFTSPSPALCGVFVDGASLVVSGECDGAVRARDVEGTTTSSRVVGAHDEATSCAAHDPAHACVVFSASYDRTIKAWDLRAPSTAGRCAATIKLQGKALTCDVARGTLFVGASDGQIVAYKTTDILACGGGVAPPRAAMNRPSSMRFQTRCVRGDPTRGDRVVVASVEGRVAVERVDADERFAFKCHRHTIPERGEVVYPVHAVAFHPLGTFATGGGDGVVNIWDADARKRLFQCPRYPTSISSLAFSPCGSMLAVASSYAQEEREANTPLSRLYIRVIGDDAEVTPKAAAAK